MKYILILFVLTLISCSPESRIAGILKKHPELIKRDTIWKNDTIIRVLHSTDTTFLTKANDTITITKDKYKLRIIRHFDTLTVHDTAYADTTFKKIATEVNSVSVKEHISFFSKLNNWLSIIGVILLFMGSLWVYFKVKG